MEEITFEIPEEIYSGLSNYYEGENYQITIKGEIVSLWAWGLAMPANSELGWEISGVKGALPVAGCATQWNRTANKPFYRKTIILELRSLQRDDNNVMVRIWNNSNFKVPLVALGLVYAI